jgi:hypothetical protein
VISNFKVAEFVRSALINGIEPNEIAKQLVQHCLGMGSTDNISIIIISFLTPEKIQKISNSDIKGMFSLLFLLSTFLFRDGFIRVFPYL